MFARRKLYLIQLWYNGFNMHTQNTQAPLKAPKQDFSQTLSAIDSDEKVLAVIKRHPFGIVKLYFQIFVGIGAALGMIYYLLPNLIDPDENAGVYTLVGLVSLVIVGFMLCIAAIATIIYNKSNLIVTDKSITQTIQTSLFSKKTSQLAVSSVEDVTANNDGVFSTIFGFGRLLIETAGEQENFHFDYCPHADHYAKLVLETRQQFMGDREIEHRQAGRAYANMAPAAPRFSSASPAFPVAPPQQSVPQQPHKVGSADPVVDIGSVAVGSVDSNQNN